MLSMCTRVRNTPIYIAGTQRGPTYCSHSQNGQQTVWRRQKQLPSAPEEEWHVKREVLGFEWTLAEGTIP